MSLIGDTELAAMRGVLNESLWDTATIRRRTVTNEGGEESEAWADHARGVACRIAPLGGGEMAGASSVAPVGGRLVDETTHIVTFTAGTDIEEADQIVISGVTYDVTLVRKRGALELSRRVEVREA